MTQQSTHAVLMVQPTSFGFDIQTAKTNAFQNDLSLSTTDVRHRANEEFKKAVTTLRYHGILVEIYHDQDGQYKPNAVFPNNWLSTWPDGTIYLYPMATESRRIERSRLVINQLNEKFEENCIIDASDSEDVGKYLESTGVMVFDHVNKVVYGCISARCDEQLFRRHARELGYEPVTFYAQDETGMAIYHTNVMLSIQTNTAVICLATIRDPRQRQFVLTNLQATNREVLVVSLDQLVHFCCNVLELQTKRGERFLALSQTAHDAFTTEQRQMLAKDKMLLPLAIPTIESVGGGSVRCMLAELFLPIREG
jgi:hypothetical protein